LTELIESVRLDALDGFQFEDLCGRIFEKLSLGKVTYVGRVADEGRDLILEGYKGNRAIVECKHQPNSTIGRPIVQKLHSATVEENARYAIVVTTGHFSKDAVNYGEKLRQRGVIVELIDFGILNDMARRAGIRLLRGGESFPIQTFFVSDPKTLSNKVSNAILSPMISSPTPAPSLATVEPRTLEFRPAYLMKYNIHEDFATSIGNISSVHLDDQIILVDGTNGEVTNPELANFMLVSERTDGIHPGHQGVISKRLDFKIDHSSLIHKAKLQIIGLHTKNVSYYGRNNVRYTKRCEPGEKSIFITSISQQYYPYWHVNIRALNRQYQVETIENRNNIRVISTDMHSCRQCGKLLKDYEKALLCNSCGAIVHRSKSHGFVCENCSRTLCRSCTYWTRKWLFLKRKVCEPCAEELAKAGRKKQKLVQPKLDGNPLNSADVSRAAVTLSGIDSISSGRSSVQPSSTKLDSNDPPRSKYLRLRELPFDKPWTARYFSCSSCGSRNFVKRRDNGIYCTTCSKLDRTI